MSFFPKGVTDAINVNATLEAKRASSLNGHLKRELNWHFRRFGKITASKFDKIKFKEVKVRGTRKDDMIKWLKSRGMENDLLGYVEENGLASIEKIKNDDLKRFVANTDGDLIMTGEAETYLAKLLWECDVSRERIINETFKLNQIPDWVSVRSRTLDYGNTFEPKAMEVYNEITGFNAIKMPTVFFDEDKLIAATTDLFCTSAADITLPNGVFIEKGRRIAIEIKNPYNGGNHYKNLFKNEIDDRYFSQCVGNLVCHEADEVHFFSYDDRVVRNKWSLVRLKREDLEPEINNLKWRLETFKAVFLECVERFGLEIPRYSV